MTEKPRILIIEDEQPIRSGLADLFVYHGYEVDLAQDGKTGLTKALSGNPDLVILDIMLPGMDGYTVCNEIRSRTRELPIIMLTARTSEEDIITGLSYGADDYVSKPFSVRELILRVEAVLRRSGKLLDSERELEISRDLVIDTRNLAGKSSAHTDPVEFTRREVEILLYLRTHADRPVSRDELLSQVWGYERASQIETRTVDIHIAKIRRKIEREPRNPVYLVTIRGEGYRLLSDKKS